MDTIEARPRGWAQVAGDRREGSLHPVSTAAEEVWSPPSRREDLDGLILSLSNDIGLILAQLAESHVDWCRRTGRDQADYAAWRRRALFAKVHKERQLRECKIARGRLAAREASPAAEMTSPHTDGVLVGLCRRILTVWGGFAAEGERPELDAALGALADYIDFHTDTLSDGDLVGRRSDEPWTR